MQRRSHQRPSGICESAWLCASKLESLRDLLQNLSCRMPSRFRARRSQELWFPSFVTRRRTACQLVRTGAAAGRRRAGERRRELVHTNSEVCHTSSPSSPTVPRHKRQWPGRKGVGATSKRRQSFFRYRRQANHQYRTDVSWVSQQSLGRTDGVRFDGEYKPKTLETRHTESDLAA